MPETFIHPRDEPVTGEVVLEFINQHKKKLTRYYELKNMYESNPDILRQPGKPEHKPDNRLVVNYSKYITDTFNGYFIGIPIKVAHDEKTINEFVDNFKRRNDLEDSEAELSKICSIYGHGFELLYQNEDSETCCTYNPPLDMFVVYDDTVAQNPLFGVRYKRSDDGVSGTLYTETGSEAFVETKDASLIFEEEVPHFYGGVPIIEYLENEERQSIFESVKSLINAYDKAVSEKANDVDYFADAYLSILGADIDEETLKNIRDNRIINLFGSDKAKEIIVEFLDKPDGDQNQENLLDRLERLIYQISMVANINDESFGNASGVSLEFKLQPMKNMAAMKERKFKSSMNRRWQMVFNVPMAVPPGQADEWMQLDYQFTRNMPRNVADEAETAGKLQGIVSEETQLSILSIVDNVKDEIERKRADEDRRGNSYGGDEDFRDMNQPGADDDGTE